MATKKRTRSPTRSQRVKDLDDEMFDEEGQPETVTDAVVEAGRATQAQREPKAKIKRVTLDGKSQYLDQVLLELVSEDWLAETYGGGKYQVMKEGMRDDDTWGYIGHDTYEIDDELPFKGSLRKQVLEKAEDAAVSSARGFVHSPDGSRAGSGASALIEAGVFNLMKSHQENAQTANQFFLNSMEQSRQAAALNQQMMMKMMEQMSSGGKSDTLDKMMPLLLAMAPKILELATRKAPGIEELLPLMDQLKPKGESERLEDVLTLLAKLKDASAMFGGEGESSGWQGMIGKALDALPAILLRQEAAKAPAAPPPAAGPRPGSATATAAVMAPALPQPQPQPQPQPASGGDAPLMIETAEDVWRVIGERIDQVRLMAAMGRNPERIALVVVEFATPEQRALLTEVLADEKFDAEFFEKFPQMKVFTRWTQEFLGVMRDELLGVEEESDSDDEVTPPDAPAPAAPVPTGE